MPAREREAASDGEARSEYPVTSFGVKLADREAGTVLGVHFAVAILSKTAAPGA